jgi:predicted nuclease of predicted toxin-antitoxin system
MIWLDAHLSPRVANWLRDEMEVEAESLRDLGLRDAEDDDIFEKARRDGAIVMTKDRDFADLVTRRGPPPSVIWLRCGNTSETRLKEILTLHLEQSLDFIRQGEALVEIQE